MSRSFVELRKSQPIPTGIEGVYVRRDVSTATWRTLSSGGEDAEEVARRIADKDPNEPTVEEKRRTAEFFLRLFDHVIVEPDGERFPDLTTVDEMVETLEQAPMTLADLPYYVSEAVQEFMGKHLSLPKAS